LSLAQATSPFLTGANSLQTNILAWLTPIAIILVMVLGAMAMAARMSWGWCLGAILGIAMAFGAPQIVVENCGNTLILRCSSSERGGTSSFASRLIGQREVLRTTTSRSRRMTQLVPSVTRSEHFNIEPAVMDSEIEQLPDLVGYLKFATRPEWRRVALDPHAAALERGLDRRTRPDAGTVRAREGGREAEGALDVTANSVRENSPSRDGFEL